MRFLSLPAFLLTISVLGPDMARAQSCPFVGTGPEVEYLAHDEASQIAIVRVHVPPAPPPVPGAGGYLILARDSGTGNDLLWWDSRVFPASTTIDRAVPVNQFPTQRISVELWVQPGGTLPVEPYLCGATAPIVIPPYDVRTEYYGPIQWRANVIHLQGLHLVPGDPVPGVYSLNLEGAPPFAQGFLGVSLPRTRIDALGGAILIDVNGLVGFIPLTTDGGGTAEVVIPESPTIDPIFNFQAFVLDPAREAGVAMSNGVGAVL